MVPLPEDEMNAVGQLQTCIFVRVTEVGFEMARTRFVKPNLTFQ